MQKLNDRRPCLTLLDEYSTVIAVIEMSQSSWLVAGIVPGVERQPLKKLAVNEAALLKLLHRWLEEQQRRQDTGSHASLSLSRPVGAAFGGALAQGTRHRGPRRSATRIPSVAVSREHRRAKTDRLDTELLKRAFLWLATRRA